MHRLSKTGEYTFTLSQTDQGKMFRLLKPLGSFDAVSDFIKDVDCLFVYDKNFGSSRSPTDKQQGAIFSKILDSSTALLDVLKSIRRGDDNSCVDVHTATLIYMSRSILVQENLRSRNELPKDNPLHIANIGIVDFTYPTQLIKSLEEMRDAVARAAEQVKTNRGNSPNRFTEVIRKRHLAEVFLANYLIRFKELPKISEKGAANKVLKILFNAAGLPVDAEKHTLRDAIERHNGIPKKKRTRKSTGNVQDET